LEAVVATRSYSFKDETVRSALEQKLRSFENASETTEKNCLYRLDFDIPGQKKRIVVKQYLTGTLVLSGDENSLLFSRLARLIAGADDLTGESPRTNSPWVGVDEAGKGDYFGPLVVAAVYSDKTILRRLRETGVRDSKKLSDDKVRDMASKLEAGIGGSINVIELMPASYNQLIDRFKRENKTLNDLLAWAASTAIKDLKKKKEFSRVIVDQFAKEHYLDRRLAGTSGLDVLQIPRGESDPAVATASIIARARFLRRLKELEKRFGTVLPKGASAQVLEAARTFIKKHGRGRLSAVAKVHFKTTASL
jgi:ribonuclease HIII